MTCTDFCTAETCRNLQKQIDTLREEILFLRQDLNFHKTEDIPRAHNYQPQITVNPTLTKNQLTIEVALDRNRGNGKVELPKTAVETVAVEIDSTDKYNQIVKVSVNGVEGQNKLTIPEPELDFAITHTAPGTFDFHLVLGNQEKVQKLIVKELAGEVLKASAGEFKVNLDYRFNLLTVTVSDGVNSDSDTVYVNPGITIRPNPFGGGGGSSNGDDEVDCQGVADALAADLAAILAAIKAVDGKVNVVKEFVTIDIEGEAIGDLTCPKEGDEEADPPKEIGVEKEYKAKGLSGLWELLKILNDNQVAVFKAACESGGILAAPDWWQVRLGGKVPQVVCSFRKGASSTYHSLAIPHPASTEKPKAPLLPAYTKGNWQGMITCTDNSKFIINCQSKAEAERMCGIAAQLIDSDYLELPPRIYIGERKGQGVSVDPMIPATIMYYETGQQNLIPNWRVRLSDFESI